MTQTTRQTKRQLSLDELNFLTNSIIELNKDFEDSKVNDFISETLIVELKKQDALII